MNNIAEGFGRRSDRAFISFLNYSKGSASEVESMLLLAADIGYLDTSKVRKWRHEIRTVAARIHGLQVYLSKQLNEQQKQ